MYSDREIFLLDDPLSSVDAHVAQHLMQNCFLGTLRNKTRILVTHNLNFLQHADRVFQMKDGKLEQVLDFKGVIE